MHLAGLDNSRYLDIHPFIYSTWQQLLKGKQTVDVDLIDNLCRSLYGEIITYNRILRKLADSAFNKQPYLRLILRGLPVMGGGLVAQLHVWTRDTVYTYLTVIGGPMSRNRLSPTTSCSQAYFTWCNVPLQATTPHKHPYHHQ